MTSTYSDESGSDGGTGPPRTIRPVLKGCYIFNFANAPRLPDKGWIIGGGKYSEGDDLSGYTPDRKEEECPCFLSAC